MQAVACALFLEDRFENSVFKSQGIGENDGCDGAAAADAVFYKGQCKLPLYSSVSFDLRDPEVIHRMLIKKTIGIAAYVSVIE